MFYEGKDEASMLKALDAIDQVSIRALARRNQRVVLECEYSEGKIAGWKAEMKGHVEDEVKFPKYGRRYSSLEEAINDLNKVMEVLKDDDPCYVLSMRDAKITGGSIVTNWFVVDPGCPYVFNKKGQPVFDVITKKLSLEEYEFVKDTRLAFYKEGILYPFTEESIYSVGAFLDCNCAFKKLDDHTLGSALLIAEKLGYRRNLQIIYRERKGNVKPILSIRGSAFVYTSQKEFFEEALKYANSLGLTKAEGWCVSSAESRLELEVLMNEPLPYKIILALSTSDQRATSFKAGVYARFDGMDMELKRNQVSHRKNAAQEMEELFFGLSAAIKDFQQKYAALCRSVCCYRKEYASLFQKVIGGKRIAAATESQPAEGTEFRADALFLYLLNITDFELKPVQRQKMTTVRHQLFLTILNESKEEVQVCGVM